MRLIVVCRGVRWTTCPAHSSRAAFRAAADYPLIPGASGAVHAFAGRFQLVAVAEPIYGDPALMRSLLPGDQLPEITVCGSRKALAPVSSLANGWDGLTSELDAELRRYGTMLGSIECH